MNIFSPFEKLGAGLSIVSNVVSNAIGKATGLSEDIDLSNAFADMEPGVPTFVEVEKVALPILREEKKPASEVFKDLKVIVHPSLTKNSETDNESDDDLVFEDVDTDVEKFIEEARKNEISENSSDDVHFQNISSNLDDFHKELDDEDIVIFSENVQNDDDSMDDFFTFGNMLNIGAKALVVSVKDSAVGIAKGLYNGPSDVIDLTKATVNGAGNIVNYLRSTSSKEGEEIETDNSEPDYPTIDHLYENVISDFVADTVQDAKESVVNTSINVARAAGVDLPALKKKADDLVTFLREDEDEDGNATAVGMVKDLGVVVGKEIYDGLLNLPKAGYDAVINSPKTTVEIVQGVYENFLERKNEDVDSFAHLDEEGDVDDETLACNNHIIEHLEETPLKDHALDALKVGVESTAEFVANANASENIDSAGKVVSNYIEEPLNQLLGKEASGVVNNCFQKSVKVLSTVAYGAERVAGVIASNNKGKDAQKLYDDYQNLVENLPSPAKALVQWGEGKVVEKGVNKVLFDRGVPEKLIAENKADLRALTGDDSTYDFCMEAIPLLGLEIRRTLIPLILKKGKAKEVLVNKKEDFESFLSVVVPRVIVNLGKAAQAASKDSDAPVNLFDIGLFLKDYLLKKFENLEAEVAKMDMDPMMTPFSRESRIKDLLDETVKDLLKLAFPNGVEDLPVNYIKPQVWNGIVDVLAEEIQNLYTDYKKNPKPKVAVKDDPKLRMLFNEGHKVLCSFAEFMHFYGQEINDRIKKVRSKGNAIEDDPKLQEMFKELSKAIIENYLNDGEGQLVIPQLLRPFTNSLIDSGLLVKPMINMYQDVLAPEASKEAYLLRLRELTGFAKVGTVGVAEQIENVGKLIGREVTRKVVEKFVQPNIDELSDDEKKLQFMWMGYLSEIVETTVLKIFVEYAEHYEGDLKLLPAAMLGDVLSGAHERFADDRIARKVEDALKIADPVMRTKALRKAFRPLANDQINRVIKGRLEDILPIPGFAKSFAANMIRKEIVPDLMAEKYIEMTKIMREDDLAKEKLQEIYNSGRPSEACRVMAAFVRNMIPAQLVVSDEELAKAIYNAAKAQLGPDATELAINNYILEHGAELKSFIAANLRAIGDPNNLAMNLTWDVAEPFIEALIRKGLATLSSKVEGIDDPKIMVNMAEGIVWALGNGHLSGLNQMKRDSNVKSFNDLPIDQQFRLFKNLHESVPNDEEALAAYKKIEENEKLRRSFVRKLDKAKTNLAKAKTEKKIALYTAERDRCRENLAAVREIIAENKAIINTKRRPYFQEYGKDMLKLAGFSKPSDLPAPAEIQEDLMPLVEDFTADAIMMVVDKIMSPAILDTFALKALDILNATEQEIVEEMKKVEIPDDEHQRNLDQAMAYMIIEMVQMAPLSGKILPIEGIKNLVGKKLSKDQAAVLGRTIRELLIKHDVSFKMLIEQGITEGLPAITQGKWEKDEAGNDVFVPYRWLLNESGEKVLDDNGNPIEVKAGKFSFDIAKTKPEAEDAEIQDERNRIANEKALRNKVVETVRTQLHGIVEAKATSLWNSLKEGFEKLIVNCFGNKYGPKIHDFLISMCEFTFFKVLGTILMTLYKPLDKAIWWVVGFYIRHKADQLIGAMHSGIHANAAGQIMDIIRDALMNNINLEDCLADMEAKKIEEERIAAEQAEQEIASAKEKAEQLEKIEQFKIRSIAQGVQIYESIKTKAADVKAKAADVKAKADEFLFFNRNSEDNNANANPHDSADLKKFEEILEMDSNQGPVFGDNIIWKDQE